MLKHSAGPRALAAALSAVMRWLDAGQIRGAIVGGIAASIRGRPRLTHDIDAIVLGDAMGWDRMVESAADYGILPRTQDVLEFASRTRILLLRHSESGIDIDVSLSGLAFETDLIDRASVVTVDRIPLRIASAEDVIIMKSLARRAKDMTDIEAILKVNEDLDLERIRQQLREFSSLLQMPEIQEKFERLLRQQRRTT